MEEPREAAALILLSHDKSEVLWARRNPALRFLGGFHGFTGGKVDPEDQDCEVRNEPDPEMRRLIACAAREAFEEVGVLLARNGEKLTRGQRVSLHDDLISGRDSFGSILDFWDLWLDGTDFHYTGQWTTPDFSSIRFKTHFFISVCPAKQEPYQAIDELGEIEFVEPAKAVSKWQNSEVLIAPPVLFSIKELEGRGSPPSVSIEEAASSLRTASIAAKGHADHMDLNSRLTLLPLRTRTLPPATHTNCFIVGKNRFVVIDAASPDPLEQEKLYRIVDGMIEEGGECAAIFVSHLHPDHHGGESLLKKHLLEKFGVEVPIIGHELTSRALEGVVAFEETISGDESYILKDDRGEDFLLEALHTPGHAKGHLCFYDREYGFLLSMDNVLGVGSVLINPPEGNMTQYLASLERMRGLPGLRFLCGSHGPAVHDAVKKIGEYVEHRLVREAAVSEALRSGAETLEKVAEIVYKDLDPLLFPLAVRSTAAHIERLAEITRPDGSDAGKYQPEGK